MNSIKKIVIINIFYIIISIISIYFINYKFVLGLKINLLILIIVLLISIAINLLYIIKINNKINEINIYLDSILAGDYTIDIRDYTEGKISILKNNVYKVTTRLKEQSELLLHEKKYLADMLADISHQIKTPLTGMNMIQDILENETKEDLRKEFLNKNREQIERIDWLISSLLKISRLDSGTIKLKGERIKVSTLIKKSVEPLKIMMESKNIKLDLCIKNFDVLVDVNWTSEALVNIIKNACEHTKDNVKIITSNNPIYKEIDIIDNGCGIKNSDLKHIFERFYKGNHNKESIGIGLNMSKKIIELQKGTIEVETKENEFTMFKIKFYQL